MTVIDEKKYFEESTIERDPDDLTCQYTMVSKKLIRNKSLSPECRWLIIYLDSYKNQKFSFSQILEHAGISMCNLKKIVKEAKDAGYIQSKE